ncbi:MAG: hypothetical protein U1G07_18140 [Verrucomicrobiota bacterium]
MKNILSALLLASLIPLTGCINLSFGSRKAPEGPAIVVPSVPLAPGDSATIAEIDAASKLTFDSAKKEALSQLAERHALSPAAQVHLVNVTYRRVTFDEAKVDILRTLIANPSFSDPARQAIVAQLHRLSFESNKQAILRHLNQRVTAPQGAA